MSDATLLPMEQLKILSFGQALAGNVCAMMLAELGAEVVKIEAPKRPDNNRQRLFPDHPRIFEPGGAETTALFGGTARSTRSLTLDMKSEAGKALFARLLDRADVVLENFGPGVMESWGFGYAAMSSINPRIVVLSLSGFGKGGPRGNYLAYGGNICSFLGLTYAWGHAHGSHHDYVAAAHGALAIMTALAYRDRTGRGTFIDLAQTETGAAVMGPIYMDFLVNDHDASPSGNAVPGSLFSTVVECQGIDRWLAVEVRNGAEWEALATALGAPDTELGNSAALEAILRNWTRGQTPHQAMIKLQHAGVACGVVQQGEDLYRDPQLRERGFVVEVTHPDLGSIEYPAPPQHLSATPARVKGHAPRLGQDSASVLSEWIGVREDAFARLQAEGTV